MTTLFALLTSLVIVPVPATPIAAFSAYADQVVIRMRIALAGPPQTDPGELGDLPLLTYAELFPTPEGGFCPATGSAGGISPEKIGYRKSIAYNPANNSLFISPGAGSSGSAVFRVGEMTVPAIATYTGDFTKAAMATAVLTATGTWIEPTEGVYNDTDRIYHITSNHTPVPNGSMVYGDRLLTAHGFFYQNQTQLGMISSRPVDLTVTGDVSCCTLLTVVPAYADGGVNSRMMQMGLGSVPSAWQSVLGGDCFVYAGNSFSLVSSQSYGPSAFGFNCADVVSAGQTTVAGATPWVMYPGNHQTLGGWDTWADAPAGPTGTGELFEISSNIYGAVIIPGTRTMVFMGRQGRGPACYGPGVPEGDPRIGQPYGNFVYCEDPEISDEGDHSWPYQHQVWMYDLLDFVKVINGDINPSTGTAWKPWDVLPYEFTAHTFPITTNSHYGNAMAYDEAGNRLFVTQMGVGCGSVNAAHGAFWVYKPVIPTP